MSRSGFIVAAAALLASVARAVEPPPPASSDKAELHERHREHMRQRVQELRELRDQRRQGRALRAEIDAELAKAHPDRALLEQKLAELSATRETRRRERQLILRRRFGEAANRDDLKQELERHAKNLARIDRMRFLAATERSGALRQRLVDRLTRIARLEEQRHQTALVRLVPPAVAAPSATPAASGAQP